MGGSAGHLGPVGGVSAVAIDHRAVAAWVRETCQAQGVPEKVTEPEVLRQVGVLLGSAPGGRRAPDASASSTQTPGAPLHAPVR